jgi:NAD(P)-dependent dehydrogenase (short-subunit alcohol dehydrogenase family)
MKTKTILITGCSSGIGKATVEYAAARGHTVLASAPHIDLLVDIPDQAAAKYVIDVCVEDSIRTAIEAATEQFGAIDVLINNAGYCQAGPVELVSADKVERQFQVNVFGPLALIRHVAPLMRANGGGCIINLSSMLGLLGMPIMGIYSASKHAVEGFSNSLRMELKDFDIDVVLIEPGWINTSLGAVAEQEAEYSWQDDPQNPYYERMTNNDGPSDNSAIEGKAIDVARVITKVLESRSPRARYKVTRLGKLLPLLVRCLPVRLTDRMLTKAIW